jgi:hypothetical protein
MNQTQRRAEGAEKDSERKTNSSLVSSNLLLSPILNPFKASANP